MISKFSSLLLVSSLSLSVMAVHPALALDDSGKTPPPAKEVLQITLSGQVSEGAPPLSLFGGTLGNSLGDLTAAIRDAAKDSKTSGILLRINAPLMGWTQAQSLRRELLRFRASGKKSYCILEYASTRTYLLASACSEVSILPSGMLELPGLSMSRMYMKGLLDNLGIEFQELRMGRYKSAVEGMTREGPSDPVREESHALIDSLYEELIDSIAENRKLSPVVVRSLIDRALFMPEDAKEAGLIDHIEYGDEMLARIRKGNENGARKIVKARIGKQLNLGAGGIAGMMALINEVFGGPKRASKSSKPKIAIINGVGQIVTGGGQQSLFGGNLMTSSQMVKLFRKVRDDESIKAVVFRVNSPGGSALASDLIWREVALTRKLKPVVVSMGDYAASGGYYVSCGANWIVAERGTLTGSIGVIGAIPNMKKLFDEIGIGYQVFSRGKRSQMISPYGELTEEGRELLMKQLRKIYDDFLGKVAQGRNLPVEAVAAVAEGRVWTGSQALEHGLVDEIGGLEVAMAKARKLGKLPVKHETLSLPKAKNLFEMLSEMEGGGDVGLRMLGSALPAELKPLLRHVEWLRNAKHEHVMTALPEVIIIK